MPRKKKPVTYVSTAPPAGVVVTAERAEGSAQLAWLRIVGQHEDQVIYLGTEATHALWAQLGPIVRDQRTELAVLEALAEEAWVRSMEAAP